MPRTKWSPNEPVRSLAKGLKTALFPFCCAAIALALSGCSPWWAYGGMKYPTAEAALGALRETNQRLLMEIPPLSGPIGRSAVVVLPTLVRVRERAVVTWQNPSEEQVGFVAEGLLLDFRSVAEAVIRRGVFERTRLSYLSNTEDLSPGEDDYVIWLHVADPDSAQWYMRGKGWPRRELLSFDQALNGAARMMSWLRELEDLVLADGQSVSAARSHHEPGSVTSGTGLIVSGEGHILTCSHVVESCEMVRTVVDGNIHQLIVLARDPINDLALLQGGALPEAACSFRGHKPVEIGEDAYAFGFPLSGLLSQQAQFTDGVVSSTAGLMNDHRFLQVTAPVQQGNSGGPLLDDHGLVVGIVVAKLDAVLVHEIMGDLPQNINFAIKAEIARMFMDAQGVLYSTQDAAKPRRASEIAKEARLWTVQVECHH